MVYGDAYLVCKVVDRRDYYLSGNNDGEFQWSYDVDDALLLTGAKSKGLISENVGFFRIPLNEFTSQ